ncbi:hypothetical protein RB195_016028 [Necator americanus]|uniref:BPTI/Kunitz inhibitor domain-containing protein n=1 Tax=Necator americanus TaxID=51031 RepID=A0ABR1E790_NECAM
MRCLLLVLFCITVINCEYASVNRFKRMSAAERCNAPMHVSNVVDMLCMRATRRYTYNEEKNICESFAYGGCGGSPNIFKTLEECRKKCVKR